MAKRKIIDSKEASEADAREHFLEELVDVMDWFKHMVEEMGDEYLTWFFKTDGHGFFDTKVTKADYASAIKQLKRLCAAQFGDGE